MEEEMDVEKCNFQNFRPWPWLGQGHISIHNMCRTTSMPNHVTLSSSNTEIWPFKIRVILRFHEVWTPDSFLTRKLENLALTSCRPGPILSQSTISFELRPKMAEEKDLERCKFFHKFRRSVTLTVTLDRVEVTQVRISGRGLPTHKIRLKLEKLFVDGHTDGCISVSEGMRAVKLCSNKILQFLIRGAS